MLSVRQDHPIVRSLSETGKRAVAAGRATASATRSEALTLARNLTTAARSDPRSAFAEFREAVVQKWERVGPRASYEVTPDWERAMHQWFGLDWPCPDAATATTIYSEVVGSMAEIGLRLGPDAFVGWCDGDPALARAAYCLTTHLQCRRVVETGVGRGITTRMVLEALDRLGDGRLYSIELPPQMRPQLNDQIACAVPTRLHDRWQFIEGPSRRRLPPLLKDLGSIELFIHDSRHTTRNVSFETSLAWPRLARGGALLVDDIDLNGGISAFRCAAGNHDLVVGPSECENPARDGLFAVVRKPAD